MTSKDLSLKRYSYQSTYLDPCPLVIPRNNDQWSIHEKMVKLVTEISSLSRDWGKIDLKFDRYVVEPIVGTTLFRRYTEKLDIKEKLVNDRSTKGTVKKVVIEKAGEWLIFKVNFVSKEKAMKEVRSDYEVARYRFADESVREFIFQTFMNSNAKIGTGVLLSVINELEVPMFASDFDTHLKQLARVMKPFLADSQRKRALEQRIKIIDKNIDSLVYNLYDLTVEEIAVIEASRQERN